MSDVVAPQPGEPRRADVPAPQRLLVRYGHFLFRYRNALFLAVMFALLFGTTPRSLGGNDRIDAYLDAAGFVVALMGQALRAAVIGYAYIVRGGRNARVYADDLVTRGIFAHSRNPLYLGNLLVVFGLFMIHNGWIVYAAGIPFFVTSYIAIVAAEEEYLRAKFGTSYDAYAHDVPRWIPRARGLSSSLADMRFNWRRVILKEYGSTYAWTGTATLLLVVETLRHHRYAERAAYLNRLWLCFAVLTIAYGAARYLKKSRRLTTAAG